MRKDRFLLDLKLDDYAASHWSVREIKIAAELPQPVKLRSCKYLNNAIERDHRDVKACASPVLGFKRFKTAMIAIAGIEVVRRIYEYQFDLFKLRIKAKLRRTFAIWS